MSVCEITHHPARYVGRKVVVEALLVDAQPHGIYIQDPGNSRCILDVGSMAAGEKGDVFDYLDPFAGEVKVRIHAILETEMRDSPFDASQQYRSYFMDRMRIIRLQP